MVRGGFHNEHHERLGVLMKQSDMANYLAVWGLLFVEDSASPLGALFSGAVRFPAQVPHVTCTIRRSLQREHDGLLELLLSPIPLQLGQVFLRDPVPAQVLHGGILAVLFLTAVGIG